MLLQPKLDKLDAILRSEGIESRDNDILDSLNNRNRSLRNLEREITLYVIKMCKLLDTKQS